MRKKNLEPFKLTEKVKDWSMLVDSRSKIFREIKTSEVGDLMGDAISSGVIRGRAKILHAPLKDSF